MPDRTSALFMLAFTAVTLLTLGRAPGAVAFRTRDLDIVVAIVVDTEAA
jgi:hypothetical protein